MFVVKRYFETESFVTVQESFQWRFPDRNPSSRSTIQRNGRLRTARNQENVDMVRALLDEQPRGISCRRIPLNLTKSTFNRISTRHDLKWHPYKICIVQELSQYDMQRRMWFCQWFTQRAHNVRFMHNIVIGDEVAFHMNGTVSTQMHHKDSRRGILSFKIAMKEITFMCGLDCVAMGVSLDHIFST